MLLIDGRDVIHPRAEECFSSRELQQEALASRTAKAYHRHETLLELMLRWRILDELRCPLIALGPLTASGEGTYTS